MTSVIALYYIFNFSVAFTFGLVAIAAAQS